MPRKRRKSTAKKKAASQKQKGSAKEPEAELVEGAEVEEAAKKDAKSVAKKIANKKAVKIEEEDKQTETEPSNNPAADEAGQTHDDSELLVEIEEGPSDISSLYDLDDNPVDMTKMDQTPRRRWWILGLAGFAILLLAIGYFGYRVFSKDFGQTGDGGVDVSIEMEKKTASGDLVTLEVEYENTKGVDLRAAELELFYPDGFFYKSATEEPEDDTGRIFELGEVKSGTGGKIQITGQLVGAKGDDKQFSALLTYQPKNFSNDFQASAEASINISSSIIQLEADVPAQAQSGQEIAYKLTFKNTANLPLENVKILIEYPKGFTYTGADIEPRGTNNDWRIDSVAAGAQESITVRGTLDGESGDTKEFRAQFGVVEIDNSFTVQSQLSSLIVVINPEVELTLSAPELVSSQEEVQFTVKVKNTSEAELRDLKIKLEFTGDLIKDESHGFDLIEKLSPFSEEEMTYTVTTKKTENVENKTLDVKAVIAKAKVEGKEVTFPNEASATVKLRGSLTATVEGRYFDDDLSKIGSGPLPPVVNKDTTYVVRWSVTNGSNAIDNFSMTTTLPAGVIWENDASSAIAYDSSSRQVSFSTDRLKAEASKEVEFTITVSPTNDDINKLLVLTKETIVSGTDVFTGEQLSDQLDRITTDLPNDEGARGKGVVEGS